MLLHYKLLTNHSGSNGFGWHGFDFHTCDNYKEGIYVWAVSSIVCFVFGFPASIAILWELLKAHRRGIPLKPNDFFMLNLSVMDMTFFVFMVPGVCNHLIWHIGVFEAIWNGFYALNGCGRPFMMACICLDCYMAVVHPIIYHKKKSLTPRIMMAGIVWTLTVAAGIAYSLNRDLYFTIFPSVPFIVAIAIIVVCDSFILHTLIRSDPCGKNIHAQKQRAIQTLINSLVIAAISYVPPVILSLFREYLFANVTMYMCIAAVPITVTSTLGSAVMPLLYLNNVGKLDRFKLCKF